MKRKHTMKIAMHKFIMKKEREYEEEGKKEKRVINKLGGSIFDRKAEESKPMAPRRNRKTANPFGKKEEEEEKPKPRRVVKKTAEIASLSALINPATFGGK